MARRRPGPRGEDTADLVGGERPLFGFKREHEAFLRGTEEAVALLQD